MEKKQKEHQTCLDLCYKHSTNHPPHPSLWSAAPLVCNQPVSGCKFPSWALRFSSGTLVRGCEETCSVLPGHCLSVHVWGRWGGSLKGQSSTCLNNCSLFVCLCTPPPPFSATSVFQLMLQNFESTLGHTFAPKKNSLSVSAWGVKKLVTHWVKKSAGWAFTHRLHHSAISAVLKIFCLVLKLAELKFLQNWFGFAEYSECVAVHHEGQRYF